MKKEFPYSAPEGYFDSLNERLAEIPAQRTRVSLAPYLVLAASFVVLFALGNFILSKTNSSMPASDDAIIEYIIESGTTLAQVEDAVDY